MGVGGGRVATGVRNKKVQLYIIQKITMNNRSLSCSWDYIRVQFVWDMLFREGEHEDESGNILEGGLPVVNVKLLHCPDVMLTTWIWQEKKTAVPSVFEQCSLN